MCSTPGCRIISDTLVCEFKAISNSHPKLLAFHGRQRGTKQEAHRPLLCSLGEVERPPCMPAQRTTARAPAKGGRKSDPTTPHHTKPHLTTHVDMYNTTPQNPGQNALSITRSSHAVGWRSLDGDAGGRAGRSVACPGVQQRGQSLDDDAHVWPEIRLVLHAQGSHGSHLGDSLWRVIHTKLWI